MEPVTHSVLLDNSNNNNIKFIIYKAQNSIKIWSYVHKPSIDIHIWSIDSCHVTRVTWLSWSQAQIYVFQSYGSPLS